MTTVKNIIRHIRGIRKKKRVPETPEEIARIQELALISREKVYTDDKIRVRDKNLDKAKAARAKALLEASIAMEAERVRQEQIQKNRIRSLRKARRKLRKIRGV
jgi:hypothetical protein